MRILLIEAYYGGSHKAWADGYRRVSEHDISLLTMPAQFWKWRMQGGAVTLARLFQQRQESPDLILATDMFDLSLFRALIRDRTAHIPTALYFHENQLTYPQNSRQRHGWQYGFINYASALVADRIYFNSPYHLNAFFEELPRMLKHFGDFNELQTVDNLRRKASVLPLAVDLKRFDPYQYPIATSNENPPLIIWNHRWEEDKNPGMFLDVLYTLVDKDIPFQVALVGENIRQKPEDFAEARQRLGDRVVAYGYLEDFADYARLLWQADYVVSTANQEFFGISVVEAMYCGCIPLLPRRLNYPYLIPNEWHHACLYRDGKLLPLLLHHLQAHIIVDTSVLKEHIAQYDWTMLVDTYDRTFTELVESTTL